MKYSANQGCISSFVVGRTGSECGLPVAVIKKRDGVDAIAIFHPHENYKNGDGEVKMIISIAFFIGIRIHNKTDCQMQIVGARRI